MEQNEQSGLPVNHVLEKFKRIEPNFNKNFLIILYQVKEIVEGETDPKDVEQCELLNLAYAKWYHKLQENPKNMDACLLLYNSVKECHDLLMKRDTQLFTINGDFLSNVFDQKGIDTPYLFDRLSDGLDEEDESGGSTEKQEVSPQEKDGKENFWNSIIGLYRLCVLICIYLQMPLVKEIIDMILLNNPDLNQKNIFEKIFSEFKGKRRLRKMIMKLLKNNGDSFGDIFNSLQKVIATFGSEVNTTAPNMDGMKQKVRGMFDGILKQSEIHNLSDDQTDRLIEALEGGKTDVLNAMVEEKLVTSEQLTTVHQKYKAAGLDKMNVSKVVKDLGATMSQMMQAIESNDESAIKDVLAKAGSGMSLDPKELEQMQNDLQKFEQEAEEDDQDNDDDDELKKIVE